MSKMFLMIFLTSMMTLTLTDSLLAQTQMPVEWNWASVSSSNLHTVAVRADGTLWSWGMNGFQNNGWWHGDGQLGDGTVTNRNIPVQIGTDTNWATVSAGHNHSAAIKTDGTIWTWGGNQAGQLGNGSSQGQVFDRNPQPNTVPIQVGSDTNWVVVSTGGDSHFSGESWGRTVAIRADGTLWAWGRGHGTSPVQIGTDTNWMYVSTGRNHTVAIRADGTLWAWGENRDGRLGDGTTRNRGSNSSVQIGTDTNWATVSAGDMHTVAVRTDGTLWAWGNNESGQLGDGTITNRLTPVQIGPATNWASVSAGGRHTLATRTNGSLWAWGSNNGGQLGSVDRNSHRTPVRIGDDTNFKSVSASSMHSIAIRTDGSLWTWGTNSGGRLGDGTTTSRSTPVQIGTAPNWSAINVAAGWSHTVAVGANGTLWSWGNHEYGRLGDDTTTIRNIPVRIGTASNWSSVSSLNAHTAALRLDGTLWVWGSNEDGQIGDGTTTNRSTPVQVGTTWASVSAGSFHTVGVGSNGTLWAWGRNNHGQLGDGSTTDRNSPVRIGADSNWAFVSAGTTHTMAIRTDGTLWAWGNNADGRLGAIWDDDEMIRSTIPIQVGTEANWMHVSTFARHTVALRADGTLWAWGFNGYGQLGDGTTVSRFTPVQVGTGNYWIAVSAGGSHTVAIWWDGSLWAWGNNNASGQLGDGSLTNRNTPRRVAAPMGLGAVSVSAGAYHTFVIGRDGMIWAWGSNWHGRLGDGTRTTGANNNNNRFAPVRVRK